MRSRDGVQSPGYLRLMKAKERLRKTLKGRGSPRLSGMAKKAHDPEKQTEYLKHLQHDEEKSNE